MLMIIIADSTVRTTCANQNARWIVNVLDTMQYAMQTMTIVSSVGVIVGRTTDAVKVHFKPIYIYKVVCPSIRNRPMRSVTLAIKFLNF